MTILELVGAGLGAFGSLLLVPRIEDRKIKIGAFCITAGFILPVYSFYTLPFDWSGIGGVTIIILGVIVWIIWQGKRQQHKI